MGIAIREAAPPSPVSERTRSRARSLLHGVRVGVIGEWERARGWRVALSSRPGRGVLPDFGLHPPQGVSFFPLPQHEEQVNRVARGISRFSAHDMFGPFTLRGAPRLAATSGRSRRRRSGTAARRSRESG